MNLVEIYLIRHGQSEANLLKIVQGTADSPLTELGKKQAKALTKVLPDTIDHIYSSTLSRAYQTGIIALDIETLKSDKITLRKELEEICFGSLQGRPYHDTGYDIDIIKRHVRFEEDILDGNHEAETIEEFFDRTHGVFEEIIEKMKDNNWKRVAIFTHGGVLRSILQYYLKLTSHRFENCEVAKLVYDTEDNKWYHEQLLDHIIFD